MAKLSRPSPQRPTTKHEPSLFDSIAAVFAMADKMKSTDACGRLFTIRSRQIHTVVYPYFSCTLCYQPKSEQQEKTENSKNKLKWTPSHNGREQSEKRTQNIFQLSLHANNHKTFSFENFYFPHAPNFSCCCCFMDRPFVWWMHKLHCRNQL